MMQLSDYDAFPATLPVVVEDDLFLYPFMISPIFLSNEKDIAAVNEAMENNSLLFVTSSQPGKEGSRDFDAMYKAGVIGTVMRKVQIPDGRVKILFQGLSRGEIIEPVAGEVNRAVIDVVKPLPYDEVRVNALMEVLKEKIRTLSSLSSSLPGDLIRTIEENDEPSRIADLISSMLKLKRSLMLSISNPMWKNVS